jgi:DNA-binding response OmpR family regulator
MLAATGEEGLEQVGYRVLGPVDNATLALRHLEEEAPTLAVIDVLLKDGRCSALARELRSRRVPFLVHSGCRQDQRLTVDFQDTPWLPKPVWPHDIVATLDELSLVPVNG